MAVTVQKISNAAVTMTGTDDMTTDFLTGVVMDAEVRYGYESTIVESLEGPTRLTGKKTGVIKLSNIIYRNDDATPPGAIGAVVEPTGVITIIVNGTSYANCLRSEGSLTIQEIWPQVYGAFGSISFAIYDDQT